MDLDREKLDRLSSEDLDCRQADGLSVPALLSSGIRTCDLYVASTASDEANLLSCLLARRLGAPACVARLERPETIEAAPIVLGGEPVFEVNPAREAALEIMRMVAFPPSVQAEPFLSGRMLLFCLDVGKKTKFAGLPLSELAKQAKDPVACCAIERKSRLIVPSKEEPSLPGDRLWLAASTASARSFLGKAGLMDAGPKNILISGGGRIAHYLSREMQKDRFKILEKDASAAARLASEIPKAAVVCRDPASEETLEDEGAPLADAFLSLGPSDEENIIVSLYAMGLGAGFTITMLNKKMPIASKIGIGSVVNPSWAAAEKIASFCEARKGSLREGGPRAVASLLGGKLKAAEFVVREGSALASAPLRALSAKEGFVLAGLERGSEARAPLPGDALAAGDAVAVAFGEKPMALTLEGAFEEAL
jgi:trk system potassium uptake protein TrkA